MAHLNYHGKIVKRWKDVDCDTRYHLTETNWLLKTTGPRMGGAKVAAKPTETERMTKLLNMLGVNTLFIEEAL